MNSTELRATLALLEDAANKAGGALIQAEADHRSALRKAIESGDFTLSIASESALADARHEHARATTSRDVARQLLAEAVRAERQAERDTAKAEIEAELAEMAETARGLDTEAAKLVGALISLRNREADLHRKAREHFRSPWAAPQTLTAARLLATFLGTLANGGQPDAKPFVAQTIASAAANIAGTFDA